MRRLLRNPLAIAAELERRRQARDTLADFPADFEGQLARMAEQNGRTLEQEAGDVLDLYRRAFPAGFPF